MNNETITTVAPREKYHSDAIYIMYAVFIILGLAFCLMVVVVIYNYFKNLCHHYGFCMKPCCCSKSKSSKCATYVVEHNSNNLNNYNNSEYFYDDYEFRESSYSYNNNISI